MNKKIITIGLLLVLLGWLWPVKAVDPVEEIQQQINELSKLRKLSEDATAPLESELKNLKGKISSVRAKLIEADQRVSELEQGIAKQESDLEENFLILSVRVRDYYKYSRTTSPLLTMLVSSNAPNLTRQLSYQSAVADENRNTIVKITQELLQLEGDKKSVEKQKIALADLRVQFEKDASFFEGEIKGAKDYQEELSGKIASLVARQNEIIAQKQGSLNLPTSLGGGSMNCSDDRNIDPGFSPALAFYTFGIPHRVGMSQYGAYGRANDGKKYEEILRAYYNFDSFEDKGNVTIRVNDGNGINQGNIIWTGSLEDYVKQIYEIPESWPEAALQAQVIAARSYALSTTESGKNSICANQYCQVFKKDQPKTGAWKDAVESTAGKVMVQGGQAIAAWYSSTDGGYTFQNNDVWGGSHRPWTKRTRDTKGDIGSFEDLLSKAYDKDSKCFYSAQGWRSENGKSAWLRPSEVADIVNAYLLAEKDGSTGDHLYQTDKPHPDGGEVWDAERVKHELSSRGGSPYSNISSVSVGADFGSGRTTSITVNGDAGSKSLNVNEFVRYFNVRAPANIQIVGPLFRVETR